MKQSGPAIKWKLRSASEDAIDAVNERDRRIEVLEGQLEDARRPRNRVHFVGGPNDGDMQLVATAPFIRPYIEVLLPNEDPTSYDEWRVREMTQGGCVRVARYRVQEVRTGDGFRLIAVFEGTR